MTYSPSRLSSLTKTRRRISTDIDHLVAFVSNPAVDAVSVLFDERFRVEHVTLIGLERDMQHAPAIGKVIQHRLGVKVALHPLPSPHLPEHYCNDIEKLLTRSIGRVAINLNTEDAAWACLVLAPLWLLLVVSTGNIGFMAMLARMLWLRESAGFRK
jgi:hypothetical protein